MNVLDFDHVIKTPVSFYAGNHYDKVFHVTKNGIDYDWAGIEDVVVLAKKDKKSTTESLLLKKSTNDIELSPGYMTWHLTADKTAIEAGTYNCFEVTIISTGNKKRVWWDSGLKVKQRAYNG